MRRYIGAGVALLMLCSNGAQAQGLETGWRVQFYKDMFQDTVFPIAVVQESGDDISPSALAIVCNGSAGLAATFTPSGVSRMQEAVSVAFRLPAGTRNFRFTAQEVPNFGGRRVADPEESAQLIEAVSSGQSPIPFRSGQAQGLIPVTGAKEAIEALRTHCPK